MAKKKNKNKIVPLSPENYIRHRSRSLPIGDCFVNKDWKEDGIANLLIVRNHSNGNLTVGIFLVDVFCLGVKDTFYRFNISQGEFDEMIDVMAQEGEMVTIDYTLAHNIIYGAIEYADKYGFEPHKDFDRITQYILEEDTEDVELVEIEFGYNGKPYLIITDMDEPFFKYKTILDRTAGPEGYDFISPYDDFDDEEELGELPDHHDFLLPTVFDDEMEEMLIDIFDKFEDKLLGLKGSMEIGDIDRIIPDSDVGEAASIRLSEIAFAGQFTDEEIKEASDFAQTFFDGVELFDDEDVISDEIRMFSEADVEKYEDALALLDKGKFKKALKEFENLYVKYPLNPDLLTHIIVCYKLMKERNKYKDIVTYAFQKLPDYLPIRNQFLLYLLNKSDEEFGKYIEKYPSLKSINPDKKIFPVSWVADYCQTIFVYFIKTDQLLKAKALLYQMEIRNVYYEGQLDFLQEIMINSISSFIKHIVDEDNTIGSLD